MRSQDDIDYSLVHNYFNNQYIKDKLLNHNDIKKSVIFEKMFYGNKYNNFIDNNIDNNDLIESIYEIVSSMPINDLIMSKCHIDELINDYVLIGNTNINNVKNFVINHVSPVIKGFYGECVVNSLLNNTLYKTRYKWNNVDDYFESKPHDYYDFSIFINDSEYLIDSKYVEHLPEGIGLFGNQDKKDNVNYIYTTKKR